MRTFYQDYGDQEHKGYETSFVSLTPPCLVPCYLSPHELNSKMNPQTSLKNLIYNLSFAKASK